MKNNAKTRTASLFGIALFLAALISSFSACDNNPNPGDGDKPAAPSGLTAGDIKENSIDVSWDSLEGVSGYTVYAGTDSGNMTQRGTPTDASFTINELTFDTTYYIAVSATNASGEGDQSNPITAKTPLAWSKIADYDKDDGDLVLGTVTAVLDGADGKFKETVFGNFSMDALAEYSRFVSGVNIDFALHNDSFMRNNPTLSDGELKNSDITGISGMTDTLVVATFTGKQVKDVIEGFVKSTSTGSWNRYCAVIVSKELSYTIDTSGATPQAINIKVNGVAIDETKDYRIAVGNFIGDNTSSGRFLPILDAEKKVKYGPTTVGQAIAMYVLAKGTINPADYPLGRYTGVVPE